MFIFCYWKMLKALLANYQLAGFNLTLLETGKTGFLMMRLILHTQRKSCLTISKQGSEIIRNGVLDC